MNYLRDPIGALKKYAAKGKIFHVHGKDANIDWDVIREFGIDGSKGYACDRFPGYGDTDWKEVLTILYKNNYTGTIDIEGFHDPYFNAELEFSAHVASLKYLKECRGGEFIANP
jgi:sugar phosphate isomerase/epimerase